MAKHTILDNWENLNAHIVDASEKSCLQLLKEEMAGKCRKQFCHRIYSRLNRVRADRERAELQAAIDAASPAAALQLHWLK